MLVTALLVGVAVAGVLVFTGDNDDDTMVAADEFQARAGSACSAFFGAMVTESVNATDPATGELKPGSEEALGARAIELGDELMSELRSIGAPEGQVDEWDEWIGLLGESIDEGRDDPASLADASLDPERSDRIDELSEALGVPECTGEELPQSEDSTAAVAALVAGAIQAESDGLITEAEAECMGEGFADEFTLNELIEFDEAGVDIEDLPTDRQAAVFEIVTRCVPAEKLLELGEPDS